jgi:hypothetical protein
VHPLQFVAPFCERVKEGRLLEQPGRLEISVLFGQSREIHQNLVHPPIFSAQHTLTLLGTDRPEKVSYPSGHALGDFQSVRIPR